MIAEVKMFQVVECWICYDLLAAPAPHLAVYGLEILPYLYFVVPGICSRGLLEFCYTFPHVGDRNNTYLFNQHL